MDVCFYLARDNRTIIGALEDSPTVPEGALLVGGAPVRWADDGREGACLECGSAAAPQIGTAVWLGKTYTTRRRGCQCPANEWFYRT